MKIRTSNKKSKRLIIFYLFNNEKYSDFGVDKPHRECCFHVAGFTGSLAFPVRV
jgi:hypothetical protein